MAKQKKYQVHKKSKSKNSMTISGGYVSSLAGISQTERAEKFKESRNGAGYFENKKRKNQLKRNRRISVSNTDYATISLFL